MIEPLSAEAREEAAELKAALASDAALRRILSAKNRRIRELESRGQMEFLIGIAVATGLILLALLLGMRP